MVRATSFLALTAVATAAPFESAPLAHAGLAARDVLSDDKDAFCKDDTTNITAAHNHWLETEAALILDDWILYYSNPDVGQFPHGWLRRLWDKYKPLDGADVVGNCANIDFDCDLSVSCPTFWEDHPVWNERPVYWIFEAVNKMHAKFGYIKDRIIQETVFADLDVDAMIEALGAGEDTAQEDLFTYLAAAFGMAGGVAGALPGAGPAVAGAAAVIGSSFSIAAVDAAHEGVLPGTIKEGLSNITQLAVGTCENMLRTAMGQAEDPSDYEKLPALSDDDFTTHIAKFFNHGYWTVNADSEEVWATSDSITSNVRGVTASMILKQATYALVADVQYKSIEECGHDTGRQWMELRPGEEYCFHLAKINGPSGEIEPTTDASIYDAMAGYGLGERDPYYRAILDCAFSGKEEKKPDVDNLYTPDGKPPTCVFNLDAFFLEYKEVTGCTGTPGPVNDPLGRCKKWVVESIV